MRVKKSLKTIHHNAAQYYGQNKSTILTGVAIGGVFVTGVFAWRAGMKAQKKLDIAEDAWNAEHEEPMPGMEKIKVVAPLAIKPAVAGAATIVAMSRAHKADVEKVATYAGLYAASEATLERYKQNLVNKIGEEAEKNLENDMLEDRAKESKSHPDMPKEENPSLIFMSDDLILFKDMEYGGEFRKRPSEIQAIENEFNYLMFGQDFASINDLRTFEGLRPLNSGDRDGFNIRRGLFHFVLKQPEYDELGRIYVPLYYNYSAASDYMSI